MKIGIGIGHSRIKNGRPEGGAVSVGGVSEWTYNGPVAEEIARIIRCAGHEVLVISDYRRAAYGDAISWLASEFRRAGTDFALELHFNSHSGPARGHEWLHWPSSVQGQALAGRIESVWRAAFPGVPARGLLPRGTGDGSGFLRKTHCPAVICEPFFGSSPEDWKAFGTRPRLVGSTIAAGVLSHIAAVTAAAATSHT